MTNKTPGRPGRPRATFERDGQLYRKCARCKAEKPVSNFRERTDRPGVSGLYVSYCNDCHDIARHEANVRSVSGREAEIEANSRAREKRKMLARLLPDLQPELKHLILPLIPDLESNVRMLRLWTKVKIRENGCWEWIGSTMPTGYGVTAWNGKHVYTHRLSYTLLRGSIPSEKPFICHHCDNPRCVNPGHLFPGTAKDNTQDMIEKGRHPRMGKKE